MKPRLRVGLIGWGTVGSELGRLVLDGPLRVELVGVAMREPARHRHGLSAELVAPVDEVIENASVVVELAGGIDEPLSWARQALEQHKAFVTANKALLATHGAELAGLAIANQSALLGSASVGGGVPMIETVEHLAATGGIETLSGLLNATTTFILSRMSHGATYETALAEAQAEGYAEADPTFDVDGRDAAQKLAILASVAWGQWRPEAEVETLGIVGLTLEPGNPVRLVAEATRERMTVRPMELDPASVMAQATGVESLLEIETADGSTFRVSGPGAGGRVTAGAVYADLARLVRGEMPVLFGGGA